jgi:hypothetical protein
MSKILSDPYRMLIRLLWLNLAFDLLSIPIWFAFSIAQNNITSTSTLSANPTVAILDAAAAVGLFAIALMGVIRKQKWGSYLAIATTVLQRVAGVFIFQLNLAMALEVIWSIIIIYFAVGNLRQPKDSQENLKAFPQTQDAKKPESVA